MITIFNEDTFEYLKGVKDNQFDIVITDPLYDVKKDAKQFLNEHLQRVSKHGVIVFCAPENPILEDVDQLMFWVKPISTKNTSRRYSRFVELIQIKGTDIWNHDRHWSQYTNVATDLVEGRTGHPFEKPISLLERLILNHTHEGMTVFDPFAGSGAVGVACHRTGRDCHMIELDPQHFENTKKRIEAL